EMEPAEDVVAQDAPSELILRFNEPIEHDLAMVTVYDWNGEPVFTGNPDGDVEKAPKMAFSLPDLKQGTYTVKWDVVSADGHPVNGDRKSTRLNSSHVSISYAVFCLKKKQSEK